MAEKLVVGQTSVTAAQMSEFWRQLAAGDLGGQHLQAMLEHRNPFELPNINWVKVYQALGMDAEYAEFIKVAKLEGNPAFWTVPVIRGVTSNKVVQAMQRLGAQLYLFANDLDAAVTHNDRDPNRDGSYAVSFSRNVEADEANKGKSANKLAKEGHKGITLLERLLLELGYFLASNGKCLDEQNITLCTGSRCGDGDVPGVGWHSGSRRVYVHWCYPDDASDSLRSRSVVSS